MCLIFITENSLLAATKYLVEDNMGWREEYKRKLVSAAEAVSVVENGHRVVIPLGEQPRQLANALAARRNELQGVTVTVGTAADFDLELFVSEGEPVFPVEIETFIGVPERPLHDAGKVTYSPLPFSLTFKTVDQRPEETKPVDVVMITVSPPDDNGLVYLGHQPWSKRGYARRARKLIAEVNPNVIRAYGGDCFLPISIFHYLVEVTQESITKKQLMENIVSEPEERKTALEEIINQVNPARLMKVASKFATVDIPRLRVTLGLDDPPDTAKAIAEQVKQFIPNGATIQIGMGTPSRYLPHLGVFDDKVDLGLHTEMVAPGVARLVKAGVINGKRKLIHRGRAVAVAWSGSDDQDLDIISDNPLFELYEPEYLLNPWVISQNSNQISLNNAVSVDLIGQINVESTFGGRMMGGIGGLPEVHLGALYSNGGRAITLLHSTALAGHVSRIVPKLEEGEFVTIPRFFADTIITEYGVATLLGKNHRERAEALIAIAHPDFRSELRKAAEGTLIF